MRVSLSGLGVAVMGLLVAAVPVVRGADPTFRTVAFSGMQAPDRPSGEVFTSVVSSRINTDGQVAFEANTVLASSGQLGGWSETQEGLRLAFRNGQSMPSLGAGYRLWLGTSFPQVSGVSSEAFFGFVEAPSGASGGGWAMIASRGGVVEPLAIEGQQIPATSCVVAELNGSSVPVITPSGQAAFSAIVSEGGGSGHTGILTNRNGTLAYVAPYGSPAPGMDGWTFLSPGEPVINDNGVMAFAASVQKPGGSASGIWLEDGGTPQLVVSSDTPMPGHPGLALGPVRVPSINNAGDVAFKGYGSGMTIWSSSSGTLSKVAAMGDRAPGTDDGVTFADVDWPLISGCGAVSLFGTLTGPDVTSANNTGIWLDLDGDLQLVARSGDVAPGTPDGVVFGSLPSWWAMNALGQIAFVSSVNGPGMPSQNSGIWFTGLDGSLNRLIGEADILTVAPGDVRTVSRVSMTVYSAGQDGRASCFDAAGRLAFTATFTDGSQGVFVATIPEPAGLVLLAAAWVALLRRRLR